jgi:hypothetical protein
MRKSIPTSSDESSRAASGAARKRASSWSSSSPSDAGAAIAKRGPFAAAPKAAVMVRRVNVWETLQRLPDRRKGRNGQPEEAAKPNEEAPIVKVTSPGLGDVWVSWPRGSSHSSEATRRESLKLGQRALGGESDVSAMDHSSESGRVGVRSQNFLRAMPSEINHGKLRHSRGGRVGFAYSRAVPRSQITELRTTADSRYYPAITFGQLATTSRSGIHPAVQNSRGTLATESNALHRVNVPSLGAFPFARTEST